MLKFFILVEKNELFSLKEMSFPLREKDIQRRNFSNNIQKEMLFWLDKQLLLLLYESIFSYEIDLETDINSIIFIIVFLVIDLYKPMIIKIKGNKVNRTFLIRQYEHQTENCKLCLLTLFCAICCLTIERFFSIHFFISSSFRNSVHSFLINCYLDSERTSLILWKEKIKERKRKKKSTKKLTKFSNSIAKELSFLSFI